MHSYPKNLTTLSPFSTFIFLLMGILILFIEQSHVIDQWIQDFFFDYALKKWMIDGADPMLRLVFYTGIKYVLILLGCILCGYIIKGAIKNRIQYGHFSIGYPEQKALFVLLCLIFIPLLIAGLKEFFYVHCPSRLIEYNGPSLFRGALEMSSFVDIHDRGKCFPAGHASGGFALMSFFFISQQKKLRLLGLLAGLSLGWVMAFYQMMKGAHFLSHTLMTLLLSWVLMTAFHHFFLKQPSPAH